MGSGTLVERFSDCITAVLGPAIGAFFGAASVRPPLCPAYAPVVHCPSVAQAACPVLSCHCPPERGVSAALLPVCVAVGIALGCGGLRCALGGWCLHRYQHATEGEVRLGSLALGRPRLALGDPGIREEPEPTPASSRSSSLSAVPSLGLPCPGGGDLAVWQPRRRNPPSS